MPRCVLRWLVAALAAGSVGGASACDSGPADPPSAATPHAVPHGSFARMPGVLCSARALAGKGDVPAATARFQDVHSDLHALASSLSDSDRAAAGRVLRAKQEVEADLAASAPSSDLAADLDTLARVVAEAQRLAVPNACG